MSKKPTMPYDVRLECIAYVRGYQRRVQAYVDARNMGDVFLERSQETRKMRAVEYAIAQCGKDITSDSIRQKLTQSIIQNCQGKHKYSRNRITIPGISEATFSRRKEKFLYDVAKYAGLL